MGEANEAPDGKQAEDDDDPIRTRLLEAAARVFASKGYSGTKILDIVREAGLSSGAVYGRYDSKNELLTEAIVTRAVQVTAPPHKHDQMVADVLIRAAVAARGPLTDDEALQLEAYVTARREPEVAEAIAEARRQTRSRVAPVVKAARADGTIAADADVESLLYFLQSVYLGSLLQRGAGISPPKGAAWRDFIEGVVRGLAMPHPKQPPANKR